MDKPAIKQRQNTIYDNMEFPDYEFREFPMTVPVVDGKVQKTPYDANHKAHPVVVVNDQSELDDLMGPGAVMVEVAAGSARLQNEDDIRAALYIQADQAGVTIDKRWTVARIEETLRAAAQSKADVV